MSLRHLTLTSLRFREPFRSFNAGEVGGVEEPEATRVVAMGIAELATPAPKATDAGVSDADDATAAEATDADAPATEKKSRRSDRDKQLTPDKGLVTK